MCDAVRVSGVASGRWVSERHNKQRKQITMMSDSYKDYDHDDDYDEEAMDNRTQIFYFRIWILLKQEYSCCFF